MPYFIYHQSNSGGYLLGPARDVVVKAADYVEANAKAAEVGVDPDAPFCHCCGRRWSMFDDDFYEPIPGFSVVDSMSEVTELIDAGVIGPEDILIVGERRYCD